MLLVLLVLVVCTIVAYSTLSSAALQAHASAHGRTAVEARLAAESGAELAMHYLMFPTKSPVALVVGGAGDVHYPGQSGVSLGSTSQFNVTVTNTAPATYQIRSVGRARDPEGAWSEATVETRVVGFGNWQALGGVQFTGDVRVNSNARVEGGLATDANFVSGTIKSGTIWAANHDGKVGWAPPPALPEMTVPLFPSLTLVRSALEWDRYYIYQGQLCRADLITGELTSLPLPSATNLGWVFVYTGTDPLYISTYKLNSAGLVGTLVNLTSTLLGATAPSGDFNNLTWNGTLVVARADLYVYGRLDFKPLVGMPALLVAGATHLPASAGELRVKGLTYFNQGIKRPADKPAGLMRDEGTVLHGNLNGAHFGSSFNGAVETLFSPGDVNLPNLTNQGIRYRRLQVESWRQVVN